MDPLASMSRRTFLRAASVGAAGGLLGLGLGRTPAAAAIEEKSRAALTAGDSRADNVHRALRLIEEDVKRALAGKKAVVIKPNMVTVDVQLAATHAECIEGVLEFLKSVWKGEVIIAESAASGPSTEGYSNYGYYRLKDRYPVRFIDLDDEPVVVRHVIDEKYRPVPVRMSRLLLDRDAFIISACNLKTHDRAVATLGLKNVAVGAPIKDKGVRWGPGSKGKSDKHLLHGGSENQGIHYNLFKMATIAAPHLTVLDGFRAMEGNGPISGTPVDHRVALASCDFVAADRLGIELMGLDFSKVGYLRFCAEEGLGQGDLARIEVLGEKPADHVRKYRTADNIESQYRWMQR